MLNNVETLANVPQIILNGGKWYAGVRHRKGARAPRSLP